MRAARNITNVIKSIRDGSLEILEVTYKDGKNNGNDRLELLCRDNETIKMVSILSESDCCDVNKFVFPLSTDILKGLCITNIYEDPEYEFDYEYNYGDNDETKSFKIHLYCSYKILVNFLHRGTESTLFGKLPKDILNIIIEKSSFDFIFYRKNCSNGYYDGCINIRIEDI